jgi:hypothetical protein
MLSNKIKAFRSFFIILAVLCSILVTAQSALAQVYINEVMPNHDTDKDWIELYNSDSQPLSLSGYTIEDGTGSTFGTGSGNTNLNSLTVPAKGYLVLKESAELKFSLNANEDVILLKSGSNIIDQIAYGSFSNAAYSGKIIPLPLKNDSFGRQHDASLLWTEFNTPTQGKNNGNLNSKITVSSTIPNQTMVQKKTEVINLNIINYLSDADGDNLTVKSASAVNPVAQTLISCQVSNNQVKISLIEATGDSAKCAVTITDGYEDFSLDIPVSTVPALQLDSNTLEFNIGGTKTAYNGSAVKVAPGKEVSLKINYKNNLDGILGYAWIALKTNQDPDFLNYLEKVWAILPGTTVNTFTHSFTVPYDVADSFDLHILIWDEDEYGDQYSHELVVPFEVVKETKHLVIENAEIADDSLACVRKTDLLLTLTNPGKTEIVPEVRIFNQKPISYSNGKFTFSAEPSINLEYFGNPVSDTLQPEETKEITVPLDLTETSAKGQQTLYVYLTSPFFWKNNKFYVSDEVEIKPFEISSCLRSYRLEEALSLSKDSQNPSSADLFSIQDSEYQYLYEDSSLVDGKDFDLAFEVVHQTNDDLVDCKETIGQKKIECSLQKAGQSGLNELTVEIVDSLTKSILRENITVEVYDTINLQNVYLNGVNIHEDDLSTAVFSPNQGIELKMEVENRLDSPVTNAKVELFEVTGNPEEPILSLGTSEVFNLNAKQQTTIKTTIAPNAPDGIYDLKLVAIGFDSKKNTVTDEFPFSIKVQAKDQGLELTKLEISDEDKDLTCSPQYSLYVELLNTGNTDEDDIEMKISSGKYVEYVDFQNFPLKANGDNMGIGFSLDTKNISIGQNVVSVSAVYRNRAYETPAKTVIIKRNKCLTKFSHLDENGNWVDDTLKKDISLILDDGDQASFKVELGETGYDDSIKWYVLDLSKELSEEEPSSVDSSNSFVFEAKQWGTYNIYAEINGEQTLAYDILVSGYPVTDLLKVNLPACEDQNPEQCKQLLVSVPDFTAESNYGKVLFNQNIDLSEILDLDAAIKITDSKIVIDSKEYPQLDVPATVTLKRSFTKPLILYSEDGTSFASCPAEGAGKCTILSNSNGQLVFTVEGFSEYKAVENKDAVLEISPISVSNAEKGKEQNVSFTIKNVGTYNDLTNLDVSLLEIGSKYKASLLGKETIPAKLEAGKDFSLTLKLTTPEDEESGLHPIGKVKATALNQSGSQISTEIPVQIAAKTYLSLSNIEINGDDNLELSLTDNNEITVTVKNEYTKDLEDVVVTVTLLDGSDEIDQQESTGIDLDKGDKEDISLTLDLSEEDLEEVEYTLEILVEGEAEDGTDQQVKEEKTVKLNLEKHQVIIEDTALNPTSVQCTESSYLQVNIKNIGENDEDELKLTVKNSALGLDLVQDSLELDEFGKSSNDDTLSFTIDTYGVKAGSYPLAVNLYRDGKLEDSKTVSLEVKNCLTTSSTSGTLNEKAAQEEAVKYLDQQLQLQGSQIASSQPTVVKTSFRESRTYTLLLGLMVLLVFIAIVLALAVAMLRKRRKRMD